MAKKKDPAVNNSTYGGDYSALKLPSWEPFEAAAAEPEARTERTLGEAAKDTGVGVVKGLVTGAHDLANFGSLLVSPIVDDDPNSGIIDESAKWAEGKLQAQKSEVIRLKEDRLGALIQDPNASVSDVIAYVGSNPDLLAQISAESLPSLAIGAGVTGGLAKINAIRQFAASGKVAAATVGGVGEAAMIGGGVYGETESGLHGTAGVAMGVLTNALTPGNVGGMIAGRMAKKGAQEAGETVTTPLAEAAAGNIITRRLAEDTIKAGVARTGVATGAELTQEFGQETAQALLEQHGKTGEYNMDSALKQGAVGAMAGGVMGGGFHVAIGEGAAGTRFEIDAARAALLNRQALAQQALAADPTNPVLQNEVESTRAAVAAATTDPAQRQQVADAAIAAGTTEILTTNTVDSAIAGFNQNNQTGATMRTGAQIAEEAAAAIREVQGSYNPATAEFDTATIPAPATVTPGGPTPAGVTADGTEAVASTAPGITPADQTITPAPAVGRSLIAANNIVAAVSSNTPNADAILQVANWQAGRDPVTNISRIVAGMSGDPSEVRIARPASVPQVVWDTFVRDAQRETGIMVQHDGAIGQTVREGLEGIKYYGSRPGRMLAERLLATNNPYLDLTVGTHTGEHRGVVEHDGLGRVIGMNMSPTNSTEAAYLHESLHALTMSWLYTVPQDDPMYRELKQLMNRVKSEANSRGLHPYGTHPTNATTERSRMAEFLAEAFTRSAFQTFLDSIQVESHRTGWDTFVGWVGRLIGTTEPRQLSALDLALRINDNVLSQSSGMAAVMENQPTAPTPAPAPVPEPEPAPAPAPEPAPTSAVETARSNYVDRQIREGMTINAAESRADQIMGYSDSDLTRIREAEGYWSEAEMLAQAILAEHRAATGAPAPAADPLSAERADATNAYRQELMGQGMSESEATSVLETAPGFSSESLRRIAANPDITPAHRRFMHAEMRRRGLYVSPDATPAPTPAADPYAAARQAVVDLGWEQNAIADFEARSDADLQGIIDTTRRPAAADFARQIIARRAAEPTTGQRRRTRQSVQEAATRFREIERQNGASDATIDRMIADTERTVNNGDVADVEASIQALEDANLHSEAEYMRALLDQREAAAPAAAPMSLSEANAALTAAEDAYISEQMSRFGLNEQQARQERDHVVSAAETDTDEEHQAGLVEWRRLTENAAAALSEAARQYDAVLRSNPYPAAAAAAAAAAATPAAVTGSDASRAAAMRTAREGAIQLEMDRYGFTRQEAEEEVAALEDRLFRENTDRLDIGIRNQSAQSWTGPRAAFMQAIRDLRAAGFDSAADAGAGPVTATAPAAAATTDEGTRLREAMITYYRDDYGSRNPDLLANNVDRYSDGELSNLARNQGVAPAVAEYARYLLRSRSGAAAPAAAAPTAAAPTAAAPTAAQRAARTRAQNRFMAYLPTAYGPHHGPTTDANRNSRSEVMRRAVIQTTNRLRRHPHARMNILRDRVVRGVVNSMGADAAQAWMIERIHGQYGTTAASATPTPASAPAPTAQASLTGAFTPPPTDSDTSRTGMPTTPFASGAAAPTPVAAPASAPAAQATVSDYVSDIDLAEHTLQQVTGYPQYLGSALTRARIVGMSEQELATLATEATQRGWTNTTGVIRAVQNLQAARAGHTPPHPRFVAPVATRSSSGPTWPGTAPVADLETQDYGGTARAQQSAVPVTEIVPPTVEQDYTRRLNAAKQSGALKRLADFWRTVIAAPGQRMFEAGDIPLDDLKALVQANGNQLNQAHLTELKRRYNDAFYRKAAEWAAAHGEPAPAREDIITSLSGQGSSASIGLYGVGRGNPANPYLRARNAQGGTPTVNASLGSHNTTTGLSAAPGSSDIAYRVSADMAYLRGGSSRASGSLLSNNNVRRQVQSMVHGLRLNNPASFSPMGSSDSQSQQGQPSEYNSLSDDDKIGANVLRTLHNAFINRENGRYLSKARALGNLVLNPDGQSYTAVGDPIDTRGFPAGATVTKRQLKDKLRELNSFDRSSSGGMGMDMITLSMLSQQVLNDFEQNPDANIPQALVDMARTFGTDTGGWLMSQDEGTPDRDYQTEMDSLMAEHAMPETTKERRAEINAELAELQDAQMDAAEDEPFDAEAADRMTGEMQGMAEAGAAFEAAGAGRATPDTELFSMDEGVPSDPAEANSPAGQIGITTQPVAPASRNEIRIMDERGRGWWQRVTNAIRKAVQDKHVTLGTVLRALKDKRSLDAIDRFDGLRQAAFERLATEPMGEIEIMLNEAGISRADFENHLIQRHVREYNAHIASSNPLQITRNPQTGEEVVRGYDLETRPGSGVDNDGVPYTTSRADEYMSGEHSQAMLNAAEAYTAMIRGLQEFAIESGLESEATIEAWNRMFPNYVPFRRDLDIEENTTGTGSGFSVREGISQRAMGSTSALVDPLPATLEMLARVVDRGEKARIGQTLLATARSRPIPMYQTRGGEWKPMWRVESMPNIRTKKRVRVYNVLDAGGQPMLNGGGVPIEFYNGADARAFAANIQRTARQAQATGQNPIRAADTGFHERVVVAHNPAYIKKDNVLVIPEAGENHVLVFDEQSEQAMDMVRNLKNLDSAQLNGLFKVANVFSRWTVGTATGYNPFFAPINFIRDIQSSAININSAGVPGWTKTQSAKLIADAVKNAPALFKYLQAKHKATHSNERSSAVPVPADSPAEWMEFAKASGGLTGIRESFATFEDAVNSVQHLFGEGHQATRRDPRQNNDLGNRVSEAASNQYDAFTRWLEGDISNDARLRAFQKLTSRAPVAISNLNNAFELATRVAAFKSAFKAFEDSGLSREEAAAKAAIVSKNVSVNFNRRGTLTSQMNALFPFFNAASQGSARLAELLFEKVETADTGKGVGEKIKLTTTGKKVIMALPALGAMQAMILAAAGFEDDQPPEHVRSRNFIIPTGGTSYVMLPLPLGLNALFNMGREGMDAILHPENMRKHLLNMVSEPLTAFNPLGSTPNKALVLSPAALDIPLALYMNEDAFGRQIFKEDRDPRRPTPGFTRAKEGTSDSAIAFAETLNKWTGGNEYKGGAINITGNQVEYLLGQLGGGITREAMKTGQFAGEKITGSKADADRPWYKVPLAGKFVGDVGDSAAVRDQLYKMSAELNALNAQFEGLKDAKKREEAAALRKEHPELDKRDEVEKYFNNESKMRKARTAAQRAGKDDEVAKINDKLRTRGAELVEEIEKIKAGRAQ